MPTSPRYALCLAALLSAAPAAPGARAGALEDLLNKTVRNQADNALAVLGVSVVPSETASTLTFDGGGDSGYDFQATQFGGAFTFSDDFPLYLEGFLGASRYDPTFVFSEGDQRSLLPSKWTSFSATGGVGWDFSLTDDLVLRPMLNISLGHVESDLSLLGRFIENKFDLDLGFLDADRLNAYGYGASLMLDYALVREAYEIDSELRYTFIRLSSFEKTSAGSRATADASTLGIWNRLRVPTGLSVLGRPLRAVGEVSASLLPGDQGAALGTQWLVQAGLGLEIDFTATSVPLMTRGRIMIRYAKGERLEGFSIGLAASF